MKQREESIKININKLLAREYRAHYLYLKTLRREMANITIPLERLLILDEKVNQYEEALNKGDLIFDDELSNMINKYPEITRLDPYNVTHYVNYIDSTKYCELEELEEIYIDITKYMALLIKLEIEAGTYTGSSVYTDLNEYKNYLEKLHNNKIKDLIMDAMDRRMKVYGHDLNAEIYDDNDYLVMNLNEPNYGSRWGVFHKPSKTYYVYEDNYDELDVFYLSNDGFIKREIII